MQCNENFEDGTQSSHLKLKIFHKFYCNFVYIKYII